MNSSLNFALLLRCFMVLLCFDVMIADEISLPDCSGDDQTPGLILVSTLDGNIAALSTNGHLIWQIETGPLLQSNIHNLELTNNGQWVRIIPSLSGSLYKFDGSNIYAIPVTADNLLTSSFKYSDDMVIAGGREIRNYAVGINSGKKVYECSINGCKNTTEFDENEDIVVIEKSSYIVRAVESRSGVERWNFSIGVHSIKIPFVTCINVDSTIHSYKIKANLPNGQVMAHSESALLKTWDFKFDAPIVGIWKWDGHQLFQVDLFELPVDANVYSSSLALYVGMYNKQLYIFESEKMKEALILKKYPVSNVINSHSVKRIPWKPISVSNNALIPVDDADGSTALSVLYSSEYINGNGYFFYASNDVEKEDSLLCDNNTISKSDSNNPKDEISILSWAWWKEVILLTASVIIMNIVFNNFPNQFWFRFLPRPRNSASGDLTFQGVSNNCTDLLPLYEKKSENINEDEFNSRYLSEFETISCLGRGGFGVVFHVIKKFDDCHYAVKRILLPQEKLARERVMREVKALAKLDHKHIVRYYNAWIESPPSHWQKKLDEKLLSDFSVSSGTITSQIRHQRSTSVSVDIINLQRKRAEELDIKFENENFKNNFSFTKSSENANDCESFIVFKNSSNSSSDNSSSLEKTEEFRSHAIKKLQWRKNSRRPQSLDITSQGNVLTTNKTPPAFLYIQMQLCQEESLRDWLKNNKNRNRTFLNNIFLQIIEAVEYVHLHGLIHRDLKPSNIFFSLEGQVKIGDFGLVTSIEDTPFLETSKSSPAVSSKGYTQAVGTKLYMSPEQSKGEKYDYKVDIYSLGVILFELLIPFGTEMERVKALTNLRNKRFPDNFPEDFKQEKLLLNLMMEDNPKDRPTTFGIRARPPFSQEDALLKRDFHFQLPNLYQI